MNRLQLMALCGYLMCDDSVDKPIVPVAEKQVLVDYANERAQSFGARDWMEFYLGEQH